MKKSYKLCICGLLIAIGCVLPTFFHMFGLGTAFSPLHFPSLLCGLICGPWYGLACGVLNPILCSLLTGMPPVARLGYLVPEIACYGLFSGMFFQLIRRKKAVISAPDLSESRAYSDESLESRVSSAESLESCRTSVAHSEEATAPARLLTRQLYVALAGALLVGKIIGGIFRAMLFTGGTYTVKLWATTFFVESLPGIVVQLITIPLIYLALKKAKLIK